MTATGLPEVSAVKTVISDRGQRVTDRTEAKQVTNTMVAQRCDEWSKEANIEWARRLEEAGVHVVYGKVGLKTHGKIAFTEKLLGSIRLLGSIEAGFPSPAEEELIDTLSLDEFLVDNPASTFMLKVTGDSMIDAGIHPGDMVLVDKGITPKTDDIVIAAVDGEWTMKYFVKKGRTVELEPANRRYKTIVPKQSLEIAGVVRSVIRKYT